MVLHAVIKEVLEADEFGYEVRRSDDDDRPGMISDRIIHDIINADLVVADLTDLNPNVFYELGIRHAALKPTVHIVKVGTKLPFDNAGHGAIFVDISNWHDIIQQRKRLAATVSSIKRRDYRVSNPITQANASFAMKSSEDPKEQLIASLIERISILEQDVPSKSSSRALINSLPFALYAQLHAHSRLIAAMYRSKEDISKIANALEGYSERIGEKLISVDADETGMHYVLGNYQVHIHPNGETIDIRKI